MGGLNRRGWMMVGVAVVTVLVVAAALQAAERKRSADLDADTAAVMADPAMAEAARRWEAENRKGF